MTGKAEERESFQQQPPASGNDPENKKGLANHGVNEPHPSGPGQPEDAQKASEQR